MIKLADLVPKLPWYGPPVPEFLPDWPVRIKDVEASIRAHRHKLDIFLNSHRDRLKSKIEQIRENLINRRK